MIRSEHKSRIKKQREAYKNALTTLTIMQKIWGIRERFEEGSVFAKGMEHLDTELRYKQVKEDLELFLQEAMDDGYPELTI